MPGGGRVCGMPGQPPCPGGGGGYRGGGRTRPVSRGRGGRIMKQGGNIGPGFDCRNHWTDCPPNTYCNMSTGQCDRQGPQKPQTRRRGGRTMQGGGTLNASSGLPQSQPCPIGFMLGANGCVPAGS